MIIGDLSFGTLRPISLSPTTCDLPVQMSVSRRGALGQRGRLPYSSQMMILMVC